MFLTVSITKRVFFISMVLIGTSQSTPATFEGFSDIIHSAFNPSHYNRPPLITNRTQAVPDHLRTAKVKDEAQNMAENIEWLKKLGIDYNGMIQRGDVKNLNSMALELPENVRTASSQLLNNRLDVNFGDAMVLASPSEMSIYQYYAAIAATSYCREVTSLGLWTCKNCQKYVPDGQMVLKFNSPIADTTGFIMRSDSQKTIHVVFRGTNSLRQLITDLFIVKKDYPPVNGAQVHSGFYNSYMEVADMYFPYVQRELTTHPNYKVVISGHSLGGAQALLAALDLYQRDTRFNRNNLSVYTVGCPRIGDTSFAYYVDSTGIPFYRSVNDRDVIPHFPSQELGYLHVGIEIWDLPGYGAHICTSNIESEYCSNSIVPATHIFDHLNYFGIDEGSCL